MAMRRQLAILDFSSPSGLEQARTKSGEKKYKKECWFFEICIYVVIKAN